MLQLLFLSILFISSNSLFDKWEGDDKMIDDRRKLFFSRRERRRRSRWSPPAKGTFCVVRDSTVTGVYTNVEAARMALRRTGGSRRMVCEMINGKARDPHQVRSASGVKQHYASTTRGVWNARWQSWRDIRPMQAVCNANKACQRDTPTTDPTPSPTDVPTTSPTDVPTPFPTDVPTPSPTDVPTPSPTDLPTPSPTDVPTPSPTDVPTPSPTDVQTTIFCVVRDSTVTGVYTNVEAARIALGKTGGYRRMVCEMINGKARDPHQVVSASGVKQHFASTTSGVWNARWHSWRDITPMQAVCNANKACQSDAPPTPKPVEEPEPKCEDFAFDCETCVNKGCTFEPFPKLGGRRELTSIAMPKGMCYKTTKPEFPKVFGRRALTSPISMGGITEPGNCPTTTDPTPSPTADPSPSPTSNPTLSPTSLPTQSPTDVPKTIFCVVRDSTVTGVYTNVEAARIALGKTGGYRRMVCEMINGKARDPHQVVSASGVKQHFASTTSGVWNARWHSWRDIKPMQAVCNANKACQS